MTTAPPPSSGTLGRFMIGRRLGSGAFGEVFEALDTTTAARVALKCLHRADGTSLYRFKREFRALTDIAHPNLAQLYQLHNEGGRWFYSMEFVPGTSLLEYLSGARSEGEAEQSISRAFLERLKPTFVQLVLGISALHAAGKLHRDLKPSNVLVTEQGRVVILDFGLVTELQPQGVHHQTIDAAFTGTPSYMPPEQMAGRPVSKASDWYSVGVMLYQALCGRLPIEGENLYELLGRKRHRRPRAPREVVAELPDHLDALCLDLLSIDPADRPGGQEILERLQQLDAGAELDDASIADSLADVPLSRPSTATEPLVGRTKELLALQAAFEASRKGQAVTMLIYGESGVGKTVLARRFAAELARDEGVVVLTSRCHERESVPYKAIDGVVDELSNYMATLPRTEAAALLPHAADLLGRVFPVLRRVEAVAEAPSVTSSRFTARELRTRLFAAMRELTSRLADRHDVVLLIDDLQWADADSLALLAEMLRPPEAPGLLLLATLRTDGAGQTYADTGRSLPGDVRRLLVERLCPEDGQRLAASLLEATKTSSVDARSIADEAEGHPLFIHELVRHAASHQEQSSAPLRLDDVVCERTRKLPDDARKVLEIIAMAGAPTGQKVIARAAALEPADFDRWLAVLRMGRFVQSSGPSGDVVVDSYHDRIREALVEHLAADRRRRLHRKLAVALEACSDVDPERLLMHWLGAGEPHLAVTHAARAAADAEAALAFDHAAELYRNILRIDQGSDASSRALRLKLADALANAGRSAEAAEAYLAISAEQPVEALDLQRRAAEQYLRAGLIDEGLAVVREVLSSLGMTLPQSPLRALAALAARRARIRLRGLGFRERQAAELSPEVLARIDVCWSIASSLSMVDNIRSADFNGRTLLMALEAGEPSRLIPTLALEAIYHTTARGPRARRRVKRLFEIADKLYRKINEPESLFWVVGSRGVIEHLTGHFVTALELLERAEAITRDECAGMTWELDTMRLFALGSLFYLGRTADIARRVPQHVAEAQDKGDLYLATNLHLGLPNVAWLVRDEADEALKVAQEAERRWSQHGFHMQHWYVLQAQGQANLYAGRPHEAYERLTQRWRAFSRSMLLRIQFVRIEATHLRARLALAIAQRDPSSRDELLARVVADAKQLKREAMPWTTALADLLLSGVAAARGDAEEALRLLEAVQPRFEAVELSLFAAAADRQRARLLGGDEGRAVVAETDAWAAAREIKNPAAWAEMLAPGFPSS